MTARRAVAVAPPEQQTEALAACARHCIESGLILAAVAGDVGAALALVVSGEVDVVVVPCDDGAVPVQVAGRPYRRTYDDAAAAPRVAETPQTQRRPRLLR